MDKIIKFLKSFGLSDQEIKKVLKEVPVDQSGLAGTNVAKGIFEKGGKEVSADYPLVTETMVSPFKLDKYKGLSRKETLKNADEALSFLDKELTRTSNLILNQNLQLSPEQKINFANNLRMKRQFEKEVEAFKTQPEATIIKLETKQPVPKEGIKQLIEDVGQVSPPGTMVGNIESKINILKSKAKEKGMTMDEILKETGASQVKFMAGQNEGYVRSMARQIMYNDIKSGKLKPSKEIQDAVSGSSNIDVIEPFRNIYGENALEQLDSLVPDIKNFANEIEAEKFVRSKYEFTPKLNRPKESYTKEEMEKILEEKPATPTDKKRQLTREEIENYSEELGDPETWLSEGTIEEAEKALKRSRDEYAYMYQQYKTGKLDPVPGEQTEDRMKFLQKKLDEASMTKDRRLINQNEIKELQVLEDRFLTNPDKRTTPKEPVKNEEQTKILTDFDIKDREPNARGGRIGYAEGSEGAPSITLDTHEKASNNRDKYPIKIGDVELGISGLMTGGKNYQADPYNKFTGSERNISVRGKYNVPDTGVSILGDIGDVRMRNTRDINVPQYNYKETIRDVMKDKPYSVGIEYAPNQNRNINLRYDNQGNVSLRGEYKFAKGGLSYLMGF